jgi:4-hydroxy-4-methyl-2-oxoglutarate aldolase
VTAAHDDLAAAGVATVYEAAGRHGLLDTDLEQLIPDSRVAGPARTVRCGQDDNRAVHEAITRLRPGEVLVLTMPRPAPVALIGELLATQAQVRGAAGILVDAAVRDVDDLRRLGLPVWARWRRVRGAAKEARGELDVPVRVGGATIAPGDIVILDADGGVVVPPETVGRVAVAVAARIDREATMRARLQAGELSYDIHGLRTADEVGS